MNSSGKLEPSPPQDVQESVRVSRGCAGKHVSRDAQSSGGDSMLMVSSKQTPGELTDIEILSEVTAGNVEAYGKIVSRYSGRL